MQYEEVKKKINDIIYESLRSSIKYEDITPDKHIIDDFHVESIDALEIFLTIMSDFDIEMDRKSIAQLKNIGEIYTYVDSLLKEKAV